jgi:hypothetical protein
MSTFNLFAGWENHKSDDDDTTKKILDDAVLEQDDTNVMEVSALHHQDTFSTAQNGEADNSEANKSDWWSSMAGTIMRMGGPQKNNTVEGGGGMDVDALIESARAFTKSGDTSESKTEVNMEDFRSELDQVRAQLERKFSNIEGMDKIDATSFLYFLEAEDQKKNPSWKRRKHRFCNGLELDTVHALHDALYLAEVAYSDSVEEIQKGVESYKGGPYELVFATCEGKPREPAHFIAIKKESSNTQQQKRSGFFGGSGGDSYLEVVLVVRGTKELSDMLSDALLEASEYRDGLAHDGIMKSGKFLVEKHLPVLNHLLEKSDRNKIKLTLIGHSLGAGAAAIACMEFNDQPTIEATCIGFCCPALVNKSMSQEWKSKITTIVCDSDCVPRMSGATLANLLMDVLELDWKSNAKNDIAHLIDFLALKVPLLLPTENKSSAMDWAVGKLEDKIPEKPRGLERHELELFPPGKCIHFYRDGVGVSAAEVGCDFFNELDVSRTMVDDHYIHTGLHALFTQLMCMHKKDSKFQFRNDLMALRVEKPPKDEEEEKQ